MSTAGYRILHTQQLNRRLQLTMHTELLVEIDRIPMVHDLMKF